MAEEEKKNKTHTKTAPEFAVKKTFLCEEIGNVTFSQLLSKIIFDLKKSHLLQLFWLSGVLK